jgi:ribosomal protein S18 acetylase RimI-like enzyme
MADGGVEGGVLIRDFRRSDLDELLVLMPLCFAKEFEVSGFDPDRVRGMVDRGYGTSGRLFLGLLRVFGREPIKFLVAEADNKVVGTTIINDRGKIGYISSVMVHPDYRRKGIATKLVKSALDYVQRRKKSKAVLHVDSTNISALNLYVKLGFGVFEHVGYFLGEADSPRLSGDAGGVEVRPFQKEDLNEVYQLVRRSEEPNRLRVYDFGKADLRTSFFQRLFRFSTQNRLVAVLNGRIVGYAEAVYSTPKVAGVVSSIYVGSEEGERSRNIERALVNAGWNEIAKGGARRVRVTVSMERQGLIGTLVSLLFREALVMVGMVKEF